MGVSEERLDDRGLDPIVDPRTGRRVEPDAQVEPEHLADGDQNGKARLAVAAFDQRQVRRVDLRGARDGTNRESGVDASSAELGTDANAKVERRPARARSAIGSEELAFSHGGISADGAYRSLTSQG